MPQGKVPTSVTAGGDIPCTRPSAIDCCRRDNTVSSFAGLPPQDDHAYAWFHGDGARCLMQAVKRNTAKEASKHT